jgi:DNA primase small subunit
MAKFFVNAIRKNVLNDVLNRYGIRGKQAERVVSALSNPNNLKLMASGNFGFLPKSKRVRAMIEHVLNLCISKVSVHIDAPVTADVKRLIRFPGSLHGKTGLRVTPIKPDKIDEFEPFVDAIAFGDEKVKVRAKRKVKENIGGEEINLSAGEKALVPEYAAVFLLCRGMAVYGH